jgi:L-lactate dehydrogenase complex protein LldG
VAENGAVWVDEADLVHRALPFVAQHLAIVLPKREIVADMHAAYRRLPRPLPGYGVFISGPSKTADIEQALVVGAQGPRSLVVFLV